MAAANASARGQRSAIMASTLHELTGFYVAVDCIAPGCGGERTFAISDLANFYGRDTTVAEVLRRMRCSGGCGGRVCTGSTAVGKQLAAIAGAHMKRVTMELDGHAPAIVFDDADVDTASRLLAAAKYRNAGQVCVSPTRVLVQERVYDRFTEGFVQHTKAVKVGDGLAAGTTMGPMANPRRIAAMEAFISDARQRGATVHTGETASATRAISSSRL